MTWADEDIKNAFNAGKHRMSGETAEMWLAVITHKKRKYTDEQVEAKMKEAAAKLSQLDIPAPSKWCCMMFLALCNITPADKWNEAMRTSMQMTKDIIKFAMDNYNLKESTNNRDSFRREAVNVLLNHELIDLNPDNQVLGPNSPLTHYAIKERVLNKLK